MKVVDYWKCAKKHLDFCQKTLESLTDEVDERGVASNDLLEIYYMLGYVFEGFAVYIAFSLEYKNNTDNENPVTWNAANDIKFFDSKFSSASHLAYENKYHYSSHLKKNIDNACRSKCFDPNGKIDDYLNAEYISSKMIPTNQIDESTKKAATQLKKELEDELLYNIRINYNVTSHALNAKYNFVERMIRKKEGLASSDKGRMPYFESLDEISEEQLKLIQEWSTGLRYNYCSDSNLDEELKKIITKENLHGLVAICQKIDKLIPFYLRHRKKTV